MAAALARLGVRRAAVVTGSDGLDEVTLDGPTRVRWVEDGTISFRDLDTRRLRPLGRPGVRPPVSGPTESASRLRAVLRGIEAGPVRDSILANAAAALLIAGRVLNPAEGVQLATSAIDEGRASGLLVRWAAMSRSS